MSVATRPEMIRSDTGEVVSTAIVPFDMATYLSETKSTRSIAQQKGLMEAYDAAVGALIGDNDVQRDGNRTFKKKSAWRKLARHFNISVRCAPHDVRVERFDGGFTAIAIATGEAPWGQYWTDVGACGSDEATGRRTITEADAIATAMTRASNRAVSNLIAMGEVSAEEIGERKAQGAQPVTLTADSLLDFGKYKGTAVRDLNTKYLAWAVEPGRRLGPSTDAWQRVFNDELARREEEIDETDDDGEDGEDRVAERA